MLHMAAFFKITVNHKKCKVLKQFYKNTTATEEKQLPNLYKKRAYLVLFKTVYI